MCSITCVYSTGIRGRGVSLKNTELYQPVRLQAQNGVALIRWEGLLALQKLSKEGEIGGQIFRKIENDLSATIRHAKIIFFKRRNHISQHYQ